LVSYAASTPRARIPLSDWEATEIAAIATGVQYRWAKSALAAGWTRTGRRLHPACQRSGSR
jgi:hypothetical protein